MQLFDTQIQSFTQLEINEKLDKPVPTSFLQHKGLGSIERCERTIRHPNLLANLEGDRRLRPVNALLHLLQDARRDVSPDMEAAMLERYLSARPETDREAFLADYRALAASNAARILGRVFARQSLLGRRQYEAFMPRTWRYLERNLADPALVGLRAWMDRHVPPEARR
jgi:hypothetical protein